MPYLYITCPESAHLELIEYLDHPLGMLVASCSAFRPVSDVTCPRTCAARLDRRDRRCEPAANDVIEETRLIRSSSRRAAR